MLDRFELVKEFHVKNEQFVNCPFGHALQNCPYRREEIDFLLYAGERISKFAKEAEEIFKETKNPAMLRVHLILEEASECVQAFFAGDREELLDALCDLEYVTVGTAVAFNLPIVAGFEEVHRSNMTKAKMPSDSARLRGKGPDYRPPNLTAVFAEWEKR